MKHENLRLITISFATFAIISCLGLGISALAQAPQTARPERGFGVQGGYQTTEIDAISLQSGSVNVQIPLASLPPLAGGRLGYTLKAHYNNKLWNMYRGEARVPPTEPGCPTSYSTEYLMAADGVGWKIGATYEIFFRDANEDYDYIEPDLSTCYGQEWYHMMGRFFKPMLRTPDGSEHELVIDGYFPSYQGQRDHLRGYYKYDGMPNYSTFTTPLRFYTRDGSFLTIIYRPEPEPVRWTIYMKDGTRIETGNFGQKTIDPNGNSILQGGRLVGGVYENFVKDEYTGREIKWSQSTYNGQPATKVEYQSIGGTWQQIFVVHETILVQGKVATHTSWNPGGGGESVTPGICYAQQIVPTTSFNAIREIVFPVTEQGVPPQKYVFGYNSDTASQVTEMVQEACNLPPWQYSRPASYGWGEISDITTPTGAHIKYKYRHDGVVSFIGSSGYDVNEVVRNFITSKSITHDGETETWLYSIGGSITPTWPAAGSVTNPDGTIHTEVFNPTDPAFSGYGGPDGSAGQLVRTVDSPRVLVERKWKALGGVVQSYGGSNISINSVVEAEFTSLLSEDGLTRIKMSARKFEHDYNGEVTKVTEYDWFDPNTVTYSFPGTYRAIPIDVPSGAVVLRVTSTANHNHAFDAASSYAYHKRGPDPSAILIGKPYQLTVGDGTTVKSTTRFSYDGQSYGTAPTLGNLTKVSAHNDVNDSWIDTVSTYSPRGNMTSVTDGNGHVTQTIYVSIGGYTDLYPTQTIAAYGTSVARTSVVQYDFATGFPTLSTDVDNNVSIGTDYDILGRPTKVKNAVGTPLESWTTTEYKDAARMVIVRSDLESVGDGKKVAVQHYDQLGRVRLSRSLENAATEDPYNEQHGIKVETRYLYNDPTPSDPNDPQNTLGTYSLTSNPYRTINDPTMGWTRSKSWNTGRKQQIETFSGAALPAPWGSNSNSTGMVTTDIDADRTLVTDQAGKQRISRTNALGQLKDVWEIVPASDTWTTSVTFPNTSIAYGYHTSYGYDTLNNLTTVNQGTQQQNRTFNYSSLSRLLTAFNPESGTISYQYDPNGNLTRKTDARNIQTDYIYDALNRVTQRQYTNEPSGSETPDVSYFYDNLPNAKGKLIKVSSSVSTTEYLSFDILGRVTRSRQTTDGVEYGGGSEPTRWMTYTYNLSGALVEQQYPSGRVVKNVLDNNGDLAMVQSKKAANHGFFNYAQNFTYNAAGAVTNMQLGNGHWEGTQFNSRLQPTQIALGLTQNATNLLKLDYSYGGTTNNGNIQSQTITVPIVGQNPGFTAVQNYTYDSLNRLKQATETIGSPQTWKQTFTFDRYGNRRFDTANTTTIPPGCPESVCNPQINTENNRLIGYQFDNSGNTTVDVENRSFIYDGENKQKEVRDSQNVIVGKYFYDGDGKRVKKVVPGTDETTIFIYDASGKLVAEYSTIVAPPQDAKVSYLTNDHLGSPRINTDQNGNVTARHDYHPFGEEIFTPQRTQGLSYTGDTVRKQFTGYERDNESILDFAQARYYGYSHGRFTSPDRPLLDQSASDPQSWNLYLYAGNSPLKYTDPLGLWKQVKCEGGSSQCWEAEEGDTYASLAEILNVSPENLGEFFQNQEVVEGRTFDVSGYLDWVGQDKSGTTAVNDLAYSYGNNPPILGGVKTIGKRSGLFGWIGRQAGRAGRALGILGPKKAATVADLAAKQLTGTSGREMLKDAADIVKAFRGSAQEKAELMEAFTKQITQRTGGQWSAYSSVGADGSFIFTGEGRPFGLVIRLDGTIFKTDDIVRDAKIVGDKLLPLYDKLKQQ